MVESELSIDIGMTADNIEKVELKVEKSILKIIFKLKGEKII